MSQYRRVYLAGGVYFFTVVTYRRRAVFNTEDRIEILRTAFRKVMFSHPLRMDAIVILPDHLHCIWRLPEADSDYSSRWREIKKVVSRKIHPQSNHRNERPVWQRRFWEHVIRDQDDWRKHMDYIHYNPVKHGLVTQPKDWPWSSFSRMVDQGFYEINWGAVEPTAVANMDLE